MMCEGAGFEVLDLGKDVEPEAFVEAVKEQNPDVLGMSALLTTTMRVMGHTIQALEEAGLRDKVKIMIGGAPVTNAFADQIGADGYASNAACSTACCTCWNTRAWTSIMTKRETFWKKRAPGWTGDGCGCHPTW